EPYITVVHFDNLAKLLLLTGMIVGYAYAIEYFIAWYSGNPFERASFWNRAFGDYWWATWTMILC
ncbi:MAG: hydrogenase, partial [Acidobacteria bacterium]|nr:hydrogenase [Acidobacteriota bacterium]